MKIHRIATILPQMKGQELKELTADIKANGLLDPITTYEDQILDGRHRYTACRLANVEPRFSELPDGVDPVAFVIGRNLKRRHLTASQLAMVGADLAKLPRGRPEIKSAGLRIKQEEAAKTLGVSARSVSSAVKIKKASPKLARQVENGEITLNSAEKKLKESERQEVERRDDIGRKIPPNIMDDWDRAVQVASHLRRCAQEIKLAVAKGIDKPRDIVFVLFENDTVADAEKLYNVLGDLHPYAVCPQCQGVDRAKCQTCRHRGWISKQQFNSPMVSREMKALLLKHTT